jgi:transcriptional antiterminator Rof (Rho-off)
LDGESAYHPIACDFHDDLEAYAVTKRRVRILHLVPPDPLRSEGAFDLPLLRNEGRIQDIYTTADKEEFLRLDDGALVRLDRIRSVEAVT